MKPRPGKCSYSVKSGAGTLAPVFPVGAITPIKRELNHHIKHPTENRSSSTEWSYPFLALGKTLLWVSFSVLMLLFVQTPAFPKRWIHLFRLGVSKFQEKLKWYFVWERGFQGLFCSGFSQHRKGFLPHSRRETLQGQGRRGFSVLPHI